MHMSEVGKCLSGAFLALAISVMPMSAQAAITIFSGQDNGAATTGPFPNSLTAEANFLSAAAGFGAVRTETFQSFAVGSGGPFAFQGGSLTLNTPWGIPYGGINNDNSGNVFGFALQLQRPDQFLRALDNRLADSLYQQPDFHFWQ
jgi:hypothetical protein